MSEIPELDIAVREPPTKEKEFWMRKNKLKIFNLLIEGKTFQEIINTLNILPYGLQETICHPYFLMRLENYLSRIFFSFQINKILSVDEVLKLYWDVVMGRKEIEGLSRDQASKHYIKILGLKKQDPKVINPKQYNLIMNIFKAGSKEKLKDLAKEFGFEGLEVQQNEGPKIHSQLDKKESD